MNLRGTTGRYSRFLAAAAILLAGCPGPKPPRWREALDRGDVIRLPKRSTETGTAGQNAAPQEESSQMIVPPRPKAAGPAPRVDSKAIDEMLKEDSTKAPGEKKGPN
jgi:hypothetical protein